MDSIEIDRPVVAAPERTQHKHSYRVLFSFDGERLTTRELGWALRAFSDPAAPAGLRVRFDRLE